MNEQFKTSVDISENLNRELKAKFKLAEQKFINLTKEREQTELEFKCKYADIFNEYSLKYQNLSEIDLSDNPLYLQILDHYVLMKGIRTVNSGGFLGGTVNEKYTYLAPVFLNEDVRNIKELENSIEAASQKFNEKNRPYNSDKVDDDKRTLSFQYHDSLSGRNPFSQSVLFSDCLYSDKFTELFSNYAALAKTAANPLLNSLNLKLKN